jgi:hypothetical protein
LTSKKFILTIVVIDGTRGDPKGSCHDVLQVFQDFPEAIEENITVIVSVWERRWIFAYETNEDCSFGANRFAASILSFCFLKD